MKSTNEEISNAFSEGKFKQVYPCMADAIEWQMIGCDPIKGKTAVLEHCEKMLIEMEGSKSLNRNSVASADQVVVQGSCNYTDDKGQACRVEYCDIFKFQDDQVNKITSYVVDIKNVK